MSDKEKLYWTENLVTDPQESTLSTMYGGQITFNDLRIGFGNCRLIDDEDAECGLWFYMRNHSELDRNERAKPGSIFMIADYQVRVHGFKQSDDGWMLFVGVKQIAN